MRAHRWRGSRDAQSQTQQPPQHARGRAGFKLPALNWRRIGLSLAGMAVMALAVAALGWLLDQPIQRVIVTGRLQRVSALDVEKVVRSRLMGARTGEREAR